MNQKIIVYLYTFIYIEEPRKKIYRNKYVVKEQVIWSTRMIYEKDKIHVAYQLFKSHKELLFFGDK